MIVPKADRKSRKIVAATGLTGEPYQGNRLAAALPFVRRRGLALDVGAHIGLWSIQLAAMFGRVMAFEPHPDSLAALRQNVAGYQVEVFGCALGHINDGAYLDSAGLGAHVRPAGALGAVPVDMVTLDSFTWSAPVDFIKIDVEGFESFVLQGGERTIKQDNPVIVLEQKHESRYGLDRHTALTVLKSWGATIEWKIKNDFCARWT